MTSNSTLHQSPTQIKVADFIKEATQFRLGNLPTESSCPLTTKLSQTAQADLKSAISIFKQVEINALEKLLVSTSEIEELSRSIATCLSQGGRIFFCGCGATGRLSISLETNWREFFENDNANLKDRIVGFIAGGDYALVKSIENFEDHPEFGERQLIDLGFAAKDLMVACSEGGETPFVIGAVQKASQISNYQSYFLFCNPKDSLKHIDRSVKVFNNPKIKSLSLESGPQAICGSTRLQASSMLYFACGMALLSAHQPDQFSNQILSYLSFLRGTELQSVEALIHAEAKAYVTKSFLTYEVDEHAMPILTDLTERSPTFNLLAVENLIERSTKPATASLKIRSTLNSEIAWLKILRRPPRALSWLELKNKYNERVMRGFDFSSSGDHFRDQLIAGRVEQKIRIEYSKSSISFKNADKIICELEIPQSILELNLFLKLVFNLVSSLAQCLNQRVSGNIMLFVKPSNKKLIDRAARFTAMILKDQHGLETDYADIVECIFRASENLNAEESVVLKSVGLYLESRK